MMMKLCVLSVVVAVVAAPVVGDPTIATFDQQFDRFKDSTRLTLKFEDVIGVEGFHLDMSVHQFYAGDGRGTKRGPTMLAFFSGSSHGWRYLKTRSMDLLIDGERVSAEIKHDGTVGTGYVTEHVTPDFPQAAIDKLLAAKGVEGRIGGDEFTLNATHLAALKEFALLLADPKRAAPKGRFVRPKTADDLIAEKEKAAEAKRIADAKKPPELSPKAKLEVALDLKLRLGKALEKTNPAGAVGYYRDVVKLAPASPQAKAAKDRIAALAKR